LLITAAFGRTLISTQDASPDLEALQGYLDPAPGGMDVRYAWTLPGGRGENVAIVDIEVNWNLRHNELAAAVASPVILVRGADPQPEANVNHGTAVLGELIAASDEVGVTGIAHRARIGLINPMTDGALPQIADAITRAANALEPGDVILIEMQSFYGPRFDPQTGRGIVPVEFHNDIFDAIKAATSRGVIVVEPAGNGSENLDDPVYGGVFDRGQRDSGAIMVGAGVPPDGVDRSRAAESNYGSRVDVQGWGRSVVTCGFGDLSREQGENSWYTARFGGTSGAAAMVAGAGALIQSIVEQRGLAPMSATSLRRLLVSTGSPQTGNPGQSIGPRPDLRAAIAVLDADPHEREPQISAIKYKRSAGKLIVDGEYFIPGDSVIEIDQAAIPRLKYPSNYVLPNGTTTRIMSKGNISHLVPPGVNLAITVFTPSTGKRSEPFLFRRD
jgi:hypothetical protein